MSDGVELSIEDYGGPLADGKLVIWVDGAGIASLSLRELKAALDAIPES